MARIVPAASHLPTAASADPQHGFQVPSQASVPRTRHRTAGCCWLSPPLPHPPLVLVAVPVLLPLLVLLRSVLVVVLVLPAVMLEIPA